MFIWSCGPLRLNKDLATLQVRGRIGRDFATAAAAGSRQSQFPFRRVGIVITQRLECGSFLGSRFKP